MNSFNLFWFLLWINTKIFASELKKKFKSFWDRARGTSCLGMLFIISTTKTHTEFICAAFSGMILGASVCFLLYSIKYAVMGDLQFAKKLGYASLFGFICWLIALVVFNLIF